MARLDANIFDFDRHREALKRLGQHAQKGILLYGPPGTGKTHVIRYVSANLPGRTTVLVTAEQTVAIGFYIALARTLQPSIVVLEDVDLVDDGIIHVPLELLNVQAQRVVRQSRWRIR